jgi:hypothetical protein
MGPASTRRATARGGSGASGPTAPRGTTAGRDCGRTGARPGHPDPAALRSRPPPGPGCARDAP